MTIKKLFRAALIGLACAGVILYVSPKFSQEPATAEVLSFKNAVRIAAPAVVNIYNQTFIAESNLDAGRVENQNLASGVIMSKDGYILTNKHVIQDADQIIVALQTGQMYQAKLVGSDQLTDLAVLKIDATNLPTIPQNPNRKVHVGDIALAIGNPYNLGQSVSQGIISATGRNAVGETPGRQNFIQTDAPVNRGNSGGALINSLGELVGISTLSMGKDSSDIAEGLNFAIPISLANNVMQKIIKDGRVIRGYIGISSNILYSNGQGNSVQGVWVDTLLDGGPASKAGIQMNDIILSFDGKKVTSPAQMIKLVSDTQPHTTVMVEILRGGEFLTLPVTVEEYPES